MVDKTIFILWRENSCDQYSDREFIGYWFELPTPTEIQKAIKNRGIEIPFGIAANIKPDNKIEVIFLSGAYWLSETLPA